MDRIQPEHITMCIRMSSFCIVSGRLHSRGRKDQSLRPTLGYLLVLGYGWNEGRVALRTCSIAFGVVINRIEYEIPATPGKHGQERVCQQQPAPGRCGAVERGEKQTQRIGSHSQKRCRPGVHCYLVHCPSKPRCLDLFPVMYGLRILCTCTLRSRCRQDIYSTVGYQP